MQINPKHKAIAAYYKALEAYRQQGMTHEMALRPAFFALLEETAKQVQWTLIQEYTLPNRKRIDGALFDEFKIPRGYWEAKDTNDDLETEIAKKIALKYPLSNTIFEDTHTGILYQDGQRVMEATLAQPTELATLLTRFLAYTEPQIQEFHTAIATFQERIPELATALMQRIDDEQRTNQQFVSAFNMFYALCQDSLNPNLSRAAIKEMLVQHLLTERLFRTIFDNPDFTRRNVIASEIETVIDALTSRTLNRQEFLKKLDYFYPAIERAAATISAFSEKQHFLNTVYERFFQGFSQKQADTHGIVYTPQEIVDFMCASVEAVLHREFDKSLSSESVLILDPCVGTGNFVVNILHRLHRRTLRHKYEQELFCNEVMLLPYYIASLNIEHAYYELTGEYLPFAGISFVDTLDMEREGQATLFNQHNTQRVARQKEADITVIIGNPPYNVGQLNENDNNKNRQYDIVDERVRETYAKDSSATNRNALSDMYVKFFRWATDRLKGNDGVVCFVSNNGFLDGIAFDGMRKHLLQDFTHIYHVDLGGNARKGEGGSVFGIRVGVGITLLVRKASSKERVLFYYRMPKEWGKEQKLGFLTDKGNVYNIPWEQLHPNAKHMWLTQGLHAVFDTFLSIGKKRYDKTLFRIYSRGVCSNGDAYVYNYSRDALINTANGMVEDYMAQRYQWIRKGKPTDLTNVLHVDERVLKWIRRTKKCLLRGDEAEFDASKIRNALYRPFCKLFYYADRMFNEDIYQFPYIFPTPATEEENVLIIVSDHGYRSPFSVMVSQVIADLHTLASTDAFQCFPFYTYDEDGSNRKENITDWALAQFQAYYGDAVSKWDMFYYTYALLHHPTYRERYAENLRRELPRIPLLGDSATFHTLVTIGTRLADLHLHYEQAPEYPLQWGENRDVPWTWRVEKIKLTKDKTAIVVNNALTLSGIPSACFDYRLGNRSALEWVLDQYQVKTDKRSGIVSDPNREDDPEYIVRLVGRVVHVSVETMKLMQQLDVVEWG